MSSWDSNGTDAGGLNTPTSSSTSSSSPSSKAAAGAFQLNLDSIDKDFRSSGNQLINLDRSPSRDRGEFVKNAAWSLESFNGLPVSDSLKNWQSKFTLKGSCSKSTPCNVLAFGDSFTQGLTHDSEGRMEIHPYTKRLQSLLDSYVPNVFKVDNQGGGTETARQLLTRLGKLLDLVNEQGSRYEYTILLAGTNDLARGERAETIVERQKLLLRMLHTHKTQVLVLSVPQLNWGLPDFEERRRPANEMLREFCESGSKSRWCTFIDLTLFFPQPGTAEAEGLEPEQLAPLWDDGIHLTAKGYDKLGDLLFSRLWRLMTDPK